MAKATAKKVAPQKDAADELQELFEDGLKDIYWAEKALVKALPKMKKNAASGHLQAAIDAHLQETTDHVTRLEEIFQSIGKKAQAQKCDAMDGLIKEAEGILNETKPGPVRDAAIIAAAQKVEHYEIATYGTLATYAKLLGHKAALKPLLQTLKEEKACDTGLTKLAKTEINRKAV